MELSTPSTTIPPRRIGPREAADLLMRKKHLIVLGVSDIRQHMEFFGTLAGVFAGQCALFRAQAKWQQTANTEASCLIFPVADLSARAFLALFLPDNSKTRMAVAL